MGLGVGDSNDFSPTDKEGLFDQLNRVSTEYVIQETATIEHSEQVTQGGLIFEQMHRRGVAIAV